MAWDFFPEYNFNKYKYYEVELVYIQYVFAWAVANTSQICCM